MSISLNGDGIISGVSTLTNPSEITVGTGASVFSPTTNELALGTNGTEVGRFDSNGRFGLGSSSLDSRFVIRSHSGVSDTPILKIEHPTNNADFSISGLYDTDGNITYLGSNLYLDSAYALTQFDTGKPSSAISLSGRTGNGEIRFFTGTGAASERMRILPAGGLTFNGDTAAANALDDYEEGTWTPALRNDGGGAVYTEQTGRYTKIGRMVYGEIICAWSNKGTATDLSFTGLPFASSPLSQYTRGIIITAPTALTAGYTFYALEVSSVFSSSTIYAIEVKTDGTVNNLSTPSSGTFRAILIYSVS